MEASEEAAEIIDRAGKAIKSLVAVLGGIIKGEAGGRYDSLVNLGSLAGRNGSYLTVLKHVQEKLERALRLLTDISKADI
jgi:hypothetical protein